MKADVFVIGCGVHGARAAVAEAQAGRRVVVADEGLGMTVFWPGFFDVFGPTAHRPPSQLATRFARGGAVREASVSLDPQGRLDRLSGQDPDHPAARFDFREDRVRENFERTIELLDLPGTFHRRPVLVPTLLGTVRYADFTAAGVGWLDGVRTHLVGLESFPQWSPDWVARAAEAATGVPYDVTWIPSESAPVVSSLRLAAVWDGSTDSTIEQLVAATGARPSIVPAVLGTTFAARETIAKALAARGANVMETAGGAESAHGLRLAAHIRDRVGAVAELTGAVTALPRRSDDGWCVPVGDRVFEAEQLVVEFDTAVPPEWAEPWLEAAARPPRNAGVSPWDKHRFARRVVEVD